MFEETAKQIAKNFLSGLETYPPVVPTIEKIRIEEKRESEGEATFLVHELLAPPPFWCCLA